MRTLTPLLTLLCTVGCLQAMADEPATPPAAPAAPTAATTAAAPASTAAAPDAEAAAQAAAAAQIKKYRGMGWKPVDNNGTTVFCRSESQLGSRFEKKVCLTARQIDERTQMGKDAVADAQRQAGGGPPSH